MKEVKEIRVNIPKGYEIDEENSSFQCIKFKKVKQVNTWDDLDLEKVEGFYIDTQCSLKDVIMKRGDGNRNLFLSKKYAKAALAMAKFSQLIKYYGGEITSKEWEDDYTMKYTIIGTTGICRDVKVQGSTSARCLFAFHTREDRDRFIQYPENKQLVKDFYMMD